MTGNADLPSEVNAALDRAVWASRVYGEYDRDRVNRIVRAAAEAAIDHAERLAYDAFNECGFGVATDKIAKNRLTAEGFITEYGDRDYCGHRFDRSRKLISSPRPAGVVFAVIPSTGPVAALYFKVLCALLTRNAILLSPHPMTKRVGVKAAEVLAHAAEAAGAPAGVIQVIPEPTIPLVETVMRDARTRLVLATGGGAVVQAAYRSGTPAIGVGPGNAQVVVDETADLTGAARKIIESKSFDNSILCTAESNVLAVESIADDLLRQFAQNSTHVCDPSQVVRVRDLMYPNGKFNSAVVGKDASDLAKKAGFEVPHGTKVLLAPLPSMDDQEWLTHEKLCPVLGFHRVPDFAIAVERAQAALRVVGIGHSSVLHSRDAQRMLDFASAMPVHRIVVNEPAALGNAGFGTGLPLTMSVGTGFVGGSSSAENLNPDHFVQWSHTTFGDSQADLPPFEAMAPRPMASKGASLGRAGPGGADGSVLAALARLNHDSPEVEVIRRIVVEELRGLLRVE